MSYCFDDYQADARRTQNSDLPLWAMREHALYGLSSEVGEVLGLHQKIHQGHAMDESDLRLEIGDCLWFLSELCDVYGFDLGEIALGNIQKLKARYPDRFTPEQSINRIEYQKKFKIKREPTKSRHYSKQIGGSTE